MNYRTVVLCLLFIGLNYSCKSAKTVSGTGGLDNKLSLKKIIKAHKQSTPKFKTLQAKLGITFTQNTKSQSHTVTFKMERDKVIWLSAKLALLRVKITPEKVQFYSKLDNTYFDGDFKYLSHLLGTDIDFNKLQNLLLGQTLNTLDTEDFKHEVYEQSYMIQPKEQTDIFEAFFLLNPTHFRLNSQEFSQLKNNRLLQIEYLSYQDIEGQTLPLNTKINALNADSETIIELDYKSVKLNEALRFPFKIPNGFTEIEL